MKAATRSVGEKIRLLGRLIGPGIRMPTFVMMFVTNRCDAKCEHCFYWKELNTTKARDELTVDEVEVLTRSIGPIVQVTLTGGSPELRKDLPELAACFHRNCRPENITICMNGYHTESVVSHVRRIVESCPGQRLTISLSLDGLGEEHDRLRGMRGLFERVRATFERLGRLRDDHPGLFVTCGTCMTGLNYKTVEATADCAWNNLPIDLNKVKLVRETPPPPNRAAIAAKCDRAYLRLIRDEERWITKEDKGRFSVRSLAVRTKEVVLRQVIREIVETGHSPVCCGASRTNVTIYPDGTVAGCECRSDGLGNLRDVGMDLVRIWNGDAAREFRRKLVREVCSTHHHGYLSLPILRSPRMWPRLTRTAWKLWKGEHAAHA
jgi:MoaA/NifB/PqqE/SkfB family radical SAM enzyme